MDFNIILEAVSTVGFPIVMCIILIYYLNKMTESHKDEISEMRKTIENNTLAVQHLADSMANFKKGE